VGVSTDHHLALPDGREIRSPDSSSFGFRRTMLRIRRDVTDEKSRCSAREAAYFIVDKSGTIKFVKVMDSGLDLLNPEEVLAATKAAM